MSVIVRCPQCATQLRVGEELIGKKVRCPSCSHIFVAPATESPAPSSSVPGKGAEGNNEGWKGLNLELGGDPTPASSPASRPAPAPAPTPPTETVDPWKTMNLSLDEPEPAPPKQREELPLPTRESSGGRDREDDEPRPRARLLDDHEEMRNCPTCGKMIYREASSCSWCGERFNRGGGRRTPRYDEEDRDRDRDRDYDDRPRRRRRDWEPHRGNTIMTLGIISLVTGFANFALCIPWLIGLPMGIIAWWMATVDLGKINRSEMDPEGESSTRSGYICAIIGTIANSLIMLLCVGYIGFIGFMIANEQNGRNQRNNNPPGFRR
jgi:predicted Zn finger-like uncharacterized protein